LAIAVHTQPARAPGSRPSLTTLRALVADDLELVNSEILRQMQSRVTLIPTLASHLIAAGGKRIRPMLTLGAAKLCGYGGPHHVALAACVEFIHTATLLHDDVVDESDRRRGSATANSVWGNQASVLVGDFLFSRAFQLMVGAGSLEVLDVLSSAAAVIAEGEVAQLLNNNDTATTEAAHLEVISAKTAALFAAACRVGAIIAGRPRAEADGLESYGRELGVAFQLVDDVLDYAGQPGELGKIVGNDFKEGKITLPVILAFRRGDDSERGFWRRTVERLDQTGDDLATAAALLRKHGALAETLARARRHGALARAALSPFADGEIKQALLEAVDFSVERAY
jgi:octaprenyl-diphosphate synthase